MKPRHQVSRTAIDMIKRFEGYRRKAAQTPGGRWTLGYGHVLTAREGAEVSEEDAEALLLYDLIEVAHAVNELTLAPLNRNQFDALCSFVFNIGVENYRASAVRRRLNEGAVLQAAACMEMWRKADVQGRRIVVDALVRRRAAEKLLFLTPPDGWIAAPTPLFPPHVDLDAIEALALEGSPSLTDLLQGDPSVEPAPSYDADGLASERAAAAVGARLQQIFADSDPAPGPALRLTPAPEFDIPMTQEPLAEAEEEPRQDGPTLFDVAPPDPREDEDEQQPVVLAAVSPLERIAMAPSPRKARDWSVILAPILLALAGLALTAGALIWGSYATAAVLGFDPNGVRLVGGLAGVSMMAFGAYLALRGLEAADEA